MQVALPRFGNGMVSVFDGSPVKVSNVAGRLKMASSNLKATGRTIQQGVAQQNAKAIQDAKIQYSRINIKA
ncbi:MAG: hypothetical protein V3S46_06330 [Nitrospinota bacterium]